MVTKDLALPSHGRSYVTRNAHFITEKMRKVRGKHTAEEWKTKATYVKCFENHTEI